MFFLVRGVWRKLRANVAGLNWRIMFVFIIFHMTISWWLLYFTDEETLISRDSFLYFYVTTALTVGYGDLSPKSELGRLVAAFWIMPGSISITAALIGKTAGILVDIWKKGMNGKKDYSDKLKSHVVVLGWNPPRTLQMIHLLASEVSPGEHIVLGVTDEMENPEPEKMFFVTSTALGSKDMLLRSAASRAKKIIIYGKSDEETLTTALSVSAHKNEAHVVAHFEDPAKAELLRMHCPEIETLVDLTIELLVRSAQDPGSSLVTSELVGNLQGPTQYCGTVPLGYLGLTCKEIMVKMKAEHDATFIGLSLGQGQPVTLNPAADHVVSGGIIFYIAQRRIPAS